MPESDHPYLPPTADITLPVASEVSPAIPHSTKVSMAIGIVLCSGWPLYFGSMMIAHPAGGVGLFVAVLLMSAATCKGLSLYPRHFAALALGLIILGLLSLVPFLPAMLGGALIFLFQDLSGDRTSSGLTPIEAVLVTLTYAASYILTAWALGGIIQSFRNPEMRRSLRYRPPAQ